MKLNKLVMACAATLIVSSLASCGGSTPKASLAERYTYGETTGVAGVNVDETTGEKTGTLVSAKNETYILDLFTDNTYELSYSIGQFGYGQNLALNTIKTWGIFSKSTLTDGYTPITLSAPTEAAITMVVYLNSTSININTQDESTVYPVELPAVTQGEKNMANSKQDVLNYAGSEVTYYLDEIFILHLENPAA